MSTFVLVPNECQNDIMSRKLEANFWNVEVPDWVTRCHGNVPRFPQPWNVSLKQNDWQHNKLDPSTARWQKQWPTRCKKKTSVIIFREKWVFGERVSLSPVRRKLADFLVVATQPMDTGFNQDKTELRVLILPVALQMLADRHSLLDQAVKVLRNLRRKSWARKNSGGARYS